MGLFNLGKKGDVPLPPKPSPSELNLGQPEPLQPEQGKDEIDFEDFSYEIPTPPSNASFAQAKPEEPATSIAKTKEKVQFQELPSIDMPEQPKPKQEAYESAENVIYELPDFLDEETKTFKEAKPAEQKKETLKKPEPEPVRKTEPVKQNIEPAKTPSPQPSSQIKIKTYPKLETIEAYSEPVKPKETRMRLEEYEPIPYAEKPKPSTALKEPFLDMNRYFELKEDFETMRKLISITQDKLEHEAMLSKDKGDKYQAVAEAINYVQEKLMLMDTKLFES